MSPLLSTEIDAELSGFRRVVFASAGIGILILLAIEATLIFVFLDETTVNRLQTMNGATTMAGGLAVLILTSLLILLPTKLIAYRGYLLAKETKELAVRANASAERSAERVESLADRIEEGLALKRDGKRLAPGEELRRIRVALEEMAFVSNGAPLLKPSTSERPSFAAASEEGSTNGNGHEPAGAGQVRPGR